jgi:hypothetical protein
LSDPGRRILRREHFGALDTPAFVGTGVPSALKAP